MLALPYFDNVVFAADHITAISVSKSYNDKYRPDYVFDWYFHLHNAVLRHIFRKPKLRKSGMRWVRREWGSYEKAVIRIYVSGSEKPWTIRCKTDHIAQHWLKEYERIVDEARAKKT